MRTECRVESLWIGQIGNGTFKGDQETDLEENEEKGSSEQTAKKGLNQKGGMVSSLKYWRY